MANLRRIHTLSWKCVFSSVNASVRLRLYRQKRSATERPSGCTFALVSLYIAKKTPSSLEHRRIACRSSVKSVTHGNGHGVSTSPAPTLSWQTNQPWPWYWSHGYSSELSVTADSQFPFNVSFQVDSDKELVVNSTVFAFVRFRLILFSWREVHSVTTLI